MSKETNYPLIEGIDENHDCKLEYAELMKLFLEGSDYKKQSFINLIQNNTDFQGKLKDIIDINGIIKKVFLEKGNNMISLLEKTKLEINSLRENVGRKYDKEYKRFGISNEGKQSYIDKKVQEYMMNKIKVMSSSIDFQDTKKLETINLYFSMIPEVKIDFKKCYEIFKFREGVMEAAYIAQLSYYDLEKASDGNLRAHKQEEMDDKEDLMSSSLSDMKAYDKIIVSNKFDVITSINDEKTGFSATVFENKLTKRKTIAFRGTNDTKDKANDLFIAEGKPPIPQVREMIKFMDSLIMNGTIKPGEKINISGHSLGGVLTQICNVMYSQMINQSYSFNSPGAKKYKFKEHFSKGILTGIMSKITITDSLKKEIENMIKLAKVGVSTRELELYNKFNSAKSNGEINDKLISVDLVGTDFIKKYGEDLGKKFNVTGSGLGKIAPWQNHKISTLVTKLEQMDIKEIEAGYTHMQAQHEKKYGTDSYLVQSF